MINLLNEPSSNVLFYQLLYFQELPPIQLITKMISPQSEEWKKMSPLLYSYLSTINIPGFSSISSSTFSRQLDKKYLKYDEYKVIVAGQSEANNGIVTINNVLIPLSRDHDDERIKSTINRICQLNFQSQVTIAEQYAPKQMEGASHTSFIFVSQKRSPHLLLYELNNSWQKNTLPRLIMKGHECEITALKWNRDQIISGSKNGQLKLHNVRNGDQQARMTYQYHRERITDCCWLTPNTEQGRFLSASIDGIIYSWDKRSSLPTLKIQPKQGQINCLEYLKENCFLSGGKDGTIKFYDVRGNANKFFAYKQHSAPVTKIKKFDSKENKQVFQGQHQILFISGASNGQVMLWGQQLQFVHLYHMSEIKSITFDRGTQVIGTVQKKSPSLCLWKPAIFNYQ